MNRSAIFTAYNKAKTAARAGKLDEARTNRALGIALRTEPRPYDTTLKVCNCPDFNKRRQPCKHIIAKMIDVRAGQIKEKPMKENATISIIGRVHDASFAVGAFSVIINGRVYEYPRMTSVDRLEHVIKSQGRKIGLIGNDFEIIRS